MINVLILTEGGRESGFGHIARCLALAEAFKYREPAANVQMIVNGDKRAKSILQLSEINFKCFDWIENISEILNLITKKTVVIIDSYHAEEIFYKKIRSFKKKPVVVALDDYNRINYDADIILNPSIYGDTNYCRIGEGVSYLTGQDYIILRKEFWDIPKKKIRKEVKDILITFGGINHTGFVRKTIKQLKTKFNLNSHIIDPSKNSLTAREMLGLMLKTDICICGGGQTINELARVGVPTIGICFYENQRLNLDAWNEEGFSEYVGWYNDDGLMDKIEHAIKGLLSYRERIKRSKIGSDLLDGNGGKRIASKLMELLA